MARRWDRVRSLESGADDYIAKPFIADELLGADPRAPAAGKMGAGDEHTIARFAGWYSICHAVRSAFKGQHLLLTPIEYGILVILMKYAGRVVSHRELMNSVWGDHFSDDFSVLRVNISRLRSKLEVDPRQPTYILTVAGKGYTIAD